MAPQNSRNLGHECRFDPFYTLGVDVFCGMELTKDEAAEFERALLASAKKELRQGRYADTDEESGDDLVDSEDDPTDSEDGDEGTDSEPEWIDHKSTHSQTAHQDIDSETPHEAATRPEPNTAKLFLDAFAAGLVIHGMRILPVPLRAFLAACVLALMYYFDILHYKAHSKSKNDKIIESLNHTIEVLTQEKDAEMEEKRRHLEFMRGALEDMEKRLQELEEENMALLRE
ncbi:hypothetical protein B0T21DRAFT_343545 [Apiosordaria backusii]|uniref:Uncharacterized protein n=1 Tax=Apiosordaria backusii TaxID=314023 RepID=A0AA40K748_9PEZI|nr:hypothetical protein B0T21DRAFT_343545 [Apiosordaria backusii]